MRIIADVGHAVFALHDPLTVALFLTSVLFALGHVSFSYVRPHTPSMTLSCARGRLSLQSSSMAERKKTPKVEVIRLRVTPDQKRMLTKAAIEDGLTLSSWLLHLALQKVRVP